MRASSEARRWEHEATRMRSRIPKHATPASPGHRGRRLSQLAECGCWDCEHMMTLSMAAMEVHKEESGTRRLRVLVTWTPEARSRTE